jgi:hypothetical protein
MNYTFVEIMNWLFFIANLRVMLSFELLSLVELKHEETALNLEL